jgi:diguanylate cyclase (GGDEF)-like protein
MDALEQSVPDCLLVRTEMKPVLLDKAAIQEWQKTKHPVIDTEVVEEWQAIIDLMARIIGVPACLIMRLVDDKLSVFIRSETKDNPYHVGDSEVWFDSGLYCERVLRSSLRLSIPNALEVEEWKDNPDVKLNMISYLGFPINWPNGHPFGTICVLDNKTRHYSDEQEELILRFKNIIETNLVLIENNQQLRVLTQQLEKLAYIDSLTNILNRRAFFERSERELHRAKRYKHNFGFFMIDIDRFKQVNDRYGHDIGDKVLKAFAACVQKAKREEDVFGRIGGEEFAVLLPETSLSSTQKFAERIRKEVAALIVPIDDGSTVSFMVSIGVTECHCGDLEIDQILIQADRALYDAKEAGRNRVCIYEQ